MSELSYIVESIIVYINAETADLDPNDRAMVLLLVGKLINCGVELDIVDTLRPRKKVDE